MKKNVSKQLAEILATGTPRQKALLVCKDWTDKNTMRQEPLLTEGEVRAIRESLKTNEEKREFNKWVNAYNVYNDITPTLGLAYKEYATEAENLLGFLRVWEAYDQEANNLNAIYQALLDSGNKKAVDTFGESLDYLHFSNAKLERDEDGYININISDLYELIKLRAKSVYESYAMAKALVMVVEEYAKKTRSKSFIPDLTLSAMADITGDYIANTAPQYSQREFLAKKERTFVTKEEAKRAVYPSYDEVKVPDWALEMFRERFNNIVRSYND